VKSRAPGNVLGQAAEEIVVALAVGGDDAAFSELVRRRQSWLRNLLRRLCRDGALADDLAQQVFLQAWRSLRTLRSAQAFGGWLRRLAVNSWLAHVRSRSTQPNLTATDADPIAVEEVATAGETHRQLDLDHALSYLSADERLCVVLAYSEGMSHSEISEATAFPLGTVKSHIRRGCERLRRILNAYAPPEANHAR
jgi:RNA polymerase sigma-70 factor (ECF subfamily)